MRAKLPFLVVTLNFLYAMYVIYMRKKTMNAPRFRISGIVHLEPYDKAHAMIVAEKEKTR
jgi:fibrillarin-like rRNA methylase